MPRPKYIDMSVLSDDDNGIAEAQTPAGAGNLTLDGALVSGGVATMPEAQIIEITSDGNESGETFTVTGTDTNGNTISESGITGPNAATVTTTYYFKTVTAVEISGAGAGNIEVGASVGDGAITAPHVLNSYQTPFNVTLDFDLTAGTMTVDVEYTLDDPFDTYTNSFEVDANWKVVTGLSAQTADAVSNLAFPARAVRLKQTTGSATGTCTFTVLQGR